MTTTAIRRAIHIVAKWEADSEEPKPVTADTIHQRLAEWIQGARDACDTETREMAEELLEEVKNPAAVALGRKGGAAKGGAAKSPAKTGAARANGAKGGRPVLPYRVWGPVRGLISHHREIAAAVRARNADRRACRSLGGSAYSDASVQRRAEDGRWAPVDLEAAGYVGPDWE